MFESFLDKKRKEFADDIGKLVKKLADAEATCVEVEQEANRVLLNGDEGSPSGSIATGERLLGILPKHIRRVCVVRRRMVSAYNARASSSSQQMSPEEREKMHEQRRRIDLVTDAIWELVYNTTFKVNDGEVIGIREGWKVVAVPKKRLTYLIAIEASGQGVPEWIR